MEQLFVILVVGVFAFLNWMVKQGAAKPPAQGGPPRRPASRPVGPPREETQDEAMRKFFEALGVPPTAAPPMVHPRNPPLARSVAPKTPPVIKREPAKPIPQAAPQQPAVQPPPVAIPGAISDAYWQKPPSEPVSDISDTGAKIRTLLKSPQSIRTAVILREVLGPPRSMQA